MIIRSLFKTGSVLFIILISACTTRAQQWTYQTIPSSYLANYSSSTKTLSANRISGFQLVSLLPDGYVKDGSIDYTTYIQKGISENRTVIFPDFPVLVNVKGITIPSNTVVYFGGKSKVILSPNSAKNYQIFRIHNVSNVELYNANIVGDRMNHVDQGGEWGMGISIRGAKNVKIVNANIINCWGDGIYIGTLNNTSSVNVSISNTLIDNNRRNGISVISVNGLQIDNCVISNTAGTNPQAGLDFEPNSVSDTLSNIKINKLFTFNNAQKGVSFYLKKLISSSTNRISISLNDHLDLGSKSGLTMAGFDSKSNLDKPLQGEINIVNPRWLNNKLPFVGYNNNSLSPTTTFKNVKISTVDKSGGRENPNLIQLKKMRESLKTDKNTIFQ